MDDLRETGGSIWMSFSHALANFFGFLPDLLGAIIILAIGWILSGLVAKLIEKGLQAIGLERAVQTAGIGRFIEKTGTRWTAAKIVAELVKWFIRLIFVQAAANILGMPELTDIINSIVLFIPRVIVAMAIVVIGAMLANVLSRVVRGSLSEMGSTNANLMAKLTRGAVMAFAIIAAVNHLGIAETIVNTLFMALVGALALALGLAFGLGGREVAGQITQNWYESSKEMAQKISERANKTEPDDGGQTDALALRPPVRGSGAPPPARTATPNRPAEGGTTPPM
jgi:hypothetical protein